MTVTGEANPGEGVEEQEGLQHAVQRDPIHWVPRVRRYSGTLGYSGTQGSAVPALTALCNVYSGTLGSANTLHKAVRVEKQSSSAQERNQAESLASTCCRWVISRDQIQFDPDNASSSLRF